MIESAIHDYLAAISAITSRIGTYEFTTGTASPAILTTRSIPSDLEGTCIHVTIPTSSLFGCRGYKGGEDLADVRLWGDKRRGGSSKGESLKYLRDTATLVWENLNRAELTISSYDSWLCLADPPVFLTDPDEFPGYNISVRCVYLKSA